MNPRYAGLSAFDRRSSIWTRCFPFFLRRGNSVVFFLRCGAIFAGKGYGGVCPARTLHAPIPSILRTARSMEYPAVIPLQRLGQYAYFHRNRLMNRPAARRNRVLRGSFVRRSISRKKFSFPKLSKKHSLCEGMGTEISIT